MLVTRTDAADRAHWSALVQPIVEGLKLGSKKSTKAAPWRSLRTRSRVQRTNVTRLSVLGDERFLRRGRELSLKVGDGGNGGGGISRGRVGAPPLHRRREMTGPRLTSSKRISHAKLTINSTQACAMLHEILSSRR